MQMDTQNLIAACTAMLSLRHFITCRHFAHRLPRSDPNISATVDRILAVVDVLSVADRRLTNNHLDWHAILQLRRGDAGDGDLAWRQFKKLAFLLDPTTNKFPFSNEALTYVREAWSVLSDPEKRALYERETGTEPCKLGGDPESFWTLCPYCWNLFEYEKRYEDCTLRCQNCRKAFHGVAVEQPVKETVVEGEEHYYRYHGSVPLRYKVKKEEEEREMEDKNMGEQNFIYISDDDVDVGCEELGKKVGEGVKGDVRKEECERVVQGNGRTELQSNGQRRMRIKTVAKKVVGNRVRRQGCVDTNSDLDLDSDAEDCELEFTEGDGDIFVGVRLSK